MLVDFSAALFVDDAMKTGSIGSSTVTEPYRAPELVVHPHHHVKLGIEIDVCVLWDLQLLIVLPSIRRASLCFRRCWVLGPGVTLSSWFQKGSSMLSDRPVFNNIQKWLIACVRLWPSAPTQRVGDRRWHWQQ